MDDFTHFEQPVVAAPKSDSYVYVGSFCERKGAPYVFGTGITVTPEELKDLDVCRTHFIHKDEFDAIFGPEDAQYLSPYFTGTWSAAFSEKVEKARAIVDARRGAR